MTKTNDRYNLKSVSSACSRNLLIAMKIVTGFMPSGLSSETKRGKAYDSVDVMAQNKK